MHGGIPAKLGMGGARCKAIAGEREGDVILAEVAAELKIPYSLANYQSDDLNGRLVISLALRRAVSAMLAEIRDGSPVVEGPSSTPSPRLPPRFRLPNVPAIQ